MASKAKKVKNENSLYANLIETWNEAYKEQKSDQIQKGYNAFWKANKSNPSEVEKKLGELRLKAAKKDVSIKKYFAQSFSPPPKSSSEVSHAEQMGSNESKDTTSDTTISNVGDITSNLDEVKSVEEFQSQVKVTKPSFAQDKCKEELRVLETRISFTTALKVAGAETEDQRKQLRDDLNNRKNVMAKLQKLQRDAARKKNFHTNFRQKWEKLKLTDPDGFAKWSTELKIREARGRPSLNVTQPNLLKAIVDIVSPESSAEEKRRSESLTAHLKLDTLHGKLSAFGYELSRSALYLRLLPHRSSNVEGHRHVTTVPVRIIRAQNDKRKFHKDAHFCTATIKYLKDLCEIMGEKAVFALSQDDKAKVPLGLTAATKQAPILMHMDYKISLPDHDFVIAPGHKLTPSVYAGLVFTKQGKLGYSGPTYLAIRSAKHSKSNAESHGRDFRKVVDSENFKSIAKTESGDVKPIVVIFTDGGADENPRFEGPFKQAALHFKIFNLDAIFVATHAPGHSAQNQVERRMAPLSRDLAGVILPHQHYGTHLNSSGKTVNQQLEMENFAKAGECLADLWNGKLIDKYAVVAESILPTSITEFHDFNFMTQGWISAHVRQSQYCLQIIKCSDENCCSPLRTTLKKVLNGFLPSPCPFTKTQMGPCACPRDKTETGHYGNLSSRLALNNLVPIIDGAKPIPFDYYCPSLQSKIETRTCSKCGQYFPTIKAKKSHWKYCKLGPTQMHEMEKEDLDIEDEEKDSSDDIMEIVDENQIEIIGIENIGTWYSDIFEEIKECDDAEYCS